jgi:hypothetical protein
MGRKAIAMRIVHDEPKKREAANSVSSTDQQGMLQRLTKPQMP